MPESYPHYPKHTLVYDYFQKLASAYQLPQNTLFNATVQEVSRAEAGWKVVCEDGRESEFGLVVVCNGLLGRPRVPPYPGRFAGKWLHASTYKSGDELKGKRVLVVGGGNSGCDIAVDAAQNAAKAFHSTRRGYYYMPKFMNGKPTQEWLMSEAPKFFRF